MPDKKIPKVSAPDSLISPNSSIRGQGGNGCNMCKCQGGKGIVIDNKSSASDGRKAIDNTNAGWGSNANGQYDPVPMMGKPSY